MGDQRTIIIIIKFTHSFTIYVVLAQADPNNDATSKGSVTSSTFIDDDPLKNDTIYLHYTTDQSQVLNLLAA